MLVSYTSLAMPTVTTMDTWDFSGDARSVRPMLKLPQRLMLMLDFCTVIIILITAMVATMDSLDFSGDVRSVRPMLRLPLVPAADKFAGTLCPHRLFMVTWDDFFKMYA